MSVSDPYIDAAIGTELDGYRINGVLGRGGMGVVYEAEDVELGKKVALKMIDPVFARDEHFLRRFQAEARALARMNDPHIVNVYALRRTEAGAFIVMECVEGGTLAERMLEGPVPVREALALIKQMLTAFSHAHQLGVIHRDIKPGNIMLTRGGLVKVTDFGLAKLQHSQPLATVTQGAAGTLYYMSPEQVKALPTLDHRSDLYSLAMTIYEMLVGRLPFDKDQSEFAIMRTVVEEDVPPLTKFRSDIPRALSEIILKALAKDPDRRYQDAAEMLAAIKAFEHAHFAEGDGDRMPTPNREIWSWMRERPLAAASSGVALILILLVVTIWIVGREKAGRVDPVEPVDPPAPLAILNVATVPDGARVRIDGFDAGTSPLIETLAVLDGGVRVEVELDGFATVDTTLHLTPDETFPFSITLRADPPPDDPPEQRPGTVILSAEGEGPMRMSGRSVASGERLRLAPGTHRLECGTPPYELSTSVTVRQGQEQSITCHFMAAISVITQMEDGGLAPSGAILINGEDTGLETPREIERGPGTYTLTVRKFGYDVLNEERVTIRPTLEPQSPRRLVIRLRETR